MARRAEEDLGFARDLAQDYLTTRIVYRLDDRHREGLRLFRELSRNSVRAV
jgi:predicted solute-binding protein